MTAIRRSAAASSLQPNALCAHRTLPCCKELAQSNRHPASPEQVLGNITVGQGSIVGAHALVNKPVPPNHLAMGVPAKMRPIRADVRKFAPSGTELPADSPFGMMGEGI